MDADDSLPRRARDLIADLSRQDLDPLSVDELHARIAALEAEIARTRARLDRSAGDRLSAESLFRS
ncbi:DUF1192 family protein [Sphingomonas sp. RS2018]